MNVMTVDGYHAKIGYGEELDFFRGESLGLNGTPFKVFGKSAASCRFWASTDQKWQMIAQKISRFMADLLAVGH